MPSTLPTKRKESGEYEKVPLDGGGYKRRRVGAKHWQVMCAHGKEKKTCKACGGASICEHGRQRYRCKECGGKGLCEHGRPRSACTECGGTQQGVRRGNKQPASHGGGGPGKGVTPPPSTPSMGVQVLMI